jgi:hypothetical protein
MLDRIREWLEEHHPRLLAVYDWPGYRLLGRCWAQGCGRPMILHSPWALYACERTPMAIAITEQGMARYAELVGEPVDPAA